MSKRKLLYSGYSKKRNEKAKNQSTANSKVINNKQGMTSKQSLFKSFGGGVSKHKQELEAKKERIKYSKLPVKTVKESIKAFRNPKFKKRMGFIPKQNPVVIPKKKKSKLIKKQTKPLIIKVSNKAVSLNELIDQEMFDSRNEAIKLLKHIIAPVKNKQFFKIYWEKRPMLIKRDEPNYYKEWFSCKELDSILKNHRLEFTKNINIITYENEIKKIHNPEGRAYAPLVWDFFQEGCSINFLNPQAYSRYIWQSLSILQESFNSRIDANIHLIPAGIQGFLPHYDDIESFVLQIEGKNRWRLYNPIDNEILPRNSSQTLRQAEIGEPIIDVTLEPGDLLYFPRGFIHQTNTDNMHSLHITLSTYLKNSWGDFLLKLLPDAIEVAMQESVEFRRGLPINYLINNGVAFDDDELKKSFIEKTSSLMSKLINYAPIDSAVDQMAKKFLHDSLPPCLIEYEKTRSIHGNGEKWNEKKNCVDRVADIDPDTLIKFIRKNCVRLVIEQESCLLYHNLNNTRNYHEIEPQCLEVETDLVPAIEFLIKSYPNYVTVEELPIEKSINEKLVLVSGLYDKGLIVTGEPISSTEIESEEEEEEENLDDVSSNNSSESEELEETQENITKINNHEDDETEEENEENYALPTDETEDVDTENKKLRKYLIEEAGDYGVEIELDSDDEQDDTYDEYESGIGPSKIY